MSDRCSCGNRAVVWILVRERAVHVCATCARKLTRQVRMEVAR